MVIMNKIISISVWGNNPRYIIGAKRQIELAKTYFPDWKVLIYTDDKSNFEFVDCVEIKDNSFGAFWRFFPLFESENNIVLSRDADSRFNERESKCVEEWLNSDKNFHTFKDHPAHFEFPILAGCFGFKGKFPDYLLNIMKIYMNNNKFYLSDQFFLRDYIYPIIKDNMLIHSMNEGWFKETRDNLINKYEFCGNGYDENDVPLY